MNGLYFFSEWQSRACAESHKSQVKEISASPCHTILHFQELWRNWMYLVIFNSNCTFSESPDPPSTTMSFTSMTKWPWNTIVTIVGSLVEIIAFTFYLENPHWHKKKSTKWSRSQVLKYKGGCFYLNEKSIEDFRKPGKGGDLVDDLVVFLRFFSNAQMSKRPSVLCLFHLHT